QVIPVLVQGVPESKIEDPGQVDTVDPPDVFGIPVPGQCQVHPDVTGIAVSRNAATVIGPFLPEDLAEVDQRRDAYGHAVSSTARAAQIQTGIQRNVDGRIAEIKVPAYVN